MPNFTNDQWQEAIVNLANNGSSSVDTFGTATTITAATTFSGVPTISQLAANSSVLLANPGDQATFIAEIAVASAFVGTLSFYGLEPDGATLQLISAHQRNATTIASNTAISTASALNQVWMGSAANFKTIYVVCTAFTSGSASVQLGLSAAPYALAVLNTINALITNAIALGQNVMANSSPVTMASDQSAIPVKSSFLATPSLAAGSLNADLVPSTDVSGYARLSLQVTGTWVGTLSPQFSNDTTNWVAATVIPVDGALTFTIPRTSFSANGMFSIPQRGQYFRCRMTSYTSGTATGTLGAYTTTTALEEVSAYVLQSGVWTVQPGNTANTSPWLTNGANNNAVVAAAAGSVTVIKASPGVLACVTITTAGTVATNIYDNASAASGTVLLALPATTTLGQIFTLPGTAKLGITAQGAGAGAPGYTVYYS